MSDDPRTPAATAAVNSGAELYRRAKSLIPGGTQLLSKRLQWPFALRAAAESLDTAVSRIGRNAFSGLSLCGGVAEIEIRFLVTY